MKTKVIIVVLGIVCLGLAIAFFATKKSGDEQRVADANSIVDYSNQVVSARLKIEEINQVNLDLKNDVAMGLQRLAQLSNTLTTATATAAASAATAAATLADSKTALAGAQDKIASLTAQIANLELQNKALDQSANELTNMIVRLNVQIEAARSKLAVSDKNSAYFQQELQKQMAQRAEIEHKFNDIDALRQQVKKIKSDLFVARHAQLMQYDNSRKGAELLVTRAIVATNNSTSADFGLNVEVGSDGSVRVIPPLGKPTNAPAR